MTTLHFMHHLRHHLSPKTLHHIYQTTSCVCISFVEEKHPLIPPQCICMKDSQAVDKHAVIADMCEAEGQYGKMEGLKDL